MEIKTQGWGVEGEQGDAERKPRAQMIPRHVRIKKLPAKHKQSQVSEALGPWGVGQRAGTSGSSRDGELHREKLPSRRPTLSQGGCKAWGLKQRGQGCGKARGQPETRSLSWVGVTEPQHLRGESSRIHHRL